MSQPISPPLLTDPQPDRLLAHLGNGLLGLRVVEPALELPVRAQDVCEPVSVEVDEPHAGLAQADAGCLRV